MSSPVEEKRKSVTNFDQIQDRNYDSERALLDKEVKRGDKEEKEEKEENSTWDKLFGVFMMVISVVLMTIAVILVKLWYVFNSKLDGFDYLLVRGPIMLITAGIQVMYMKIDIFNLPPEVKFSLPLRCLIGVTASPTFFIALKYLPVSTATLVKNCSPFVVVIAAYFILKEDISVMDIVAIIGAFVGIGFVTKDNPDKDQGNVDNKHYFLGMMLCIISWVAYAGVMISSKILNKHLNPSIPPFYLSVTMVVLFFGLYIVSPGLYHVEYMTMRDFTIMAISGFVSYLAVSIRSIALKYEDASVLSPLIYLQVVLSFIWDIFVFPPLWDSDFTPIPEKQSMCKFNFSMFDFLGAALIIGFQVPNFIKAVKI